MNRTQLVTGALLAAFAFTACGGGSQGQGLLPGANVPLSPGAFQSSLQGLTPENGYYAMTAPDAARQMCPPTRDPREMRCFSWMRTDLHPSLTQRLPGTNSIPSGVGWGPADIQSAYKLDPTKGAGQTVYIVDAYGYKDIASDLTKYRSGAGLPACSLASKCFQVLNQEGKPRPLPAQNISWQGEQSLDVDAVSAACPKCKIVMIEVNNTYTLGNGVAAALAKGAKIVSMSFGGSESGSSSSSLPTSGVALVASAGDNGGGLKAGGGPQSPCTDAEIICVGGTALTKHGSTWTETTWNDEKKDNCSGPCGATGSACSGVIARPSWQSGAACPMRAAADVSAVASPLTPLAIYNTPVCGGWCGFGGTSLSAPLIAGMIGLAGNATTRHAAMEIWKSHSAFNDIRTGTNVYTPVTGPCESRIRTTCIAGAGYDGPTGWGTPKGTTGL